LLSPIMVWSRQRAATAGSASRMPSSTSRLSAFAPVRAKADRQPVQGAHQVQPQPPEVAGVAGAGAVLGPAGQLPAAHGSTLGSNAEPGHPRRHRDHATPNASARRSRGNAVKGAGLTTFPRERHHAAPPLE
jgi:hypothetical protein